MIAYPAPKDAGVKMAARIVSQPQVAGIGNLTDGDATTSVVLPAAGTLTIDLTPPEPFTARALIVRPTIKPLEAACSLQVKEGDGYRTVSDFKIDRRSSESLTVGFDRAAPVVISIPATTASDFRLIVQNTGQESALNEIELSAAPRVERYSEKTLAKMYPAPLPYWQEYQWAAQPAVEDSALLISPASVVDISQYLASDGTLTWNVPEGEWVILRTGMTPTGTTNSPAPPEATGYETDKMSRPHIEAHFDNFIGQILERIPAKDRKAFKVVVEDSYETGGQNFTDDFLESFRKRYGYDPLPYLPAYYGYVVESPEASDRFLWDVRRLVADRVAYDYVAGLREKSHKYGLTTCSRITAIGDFPASFCSTAASPMKSAASSGPRAIWGISRTVRRSRADIFTEKTKFRPNRLLRSSTSSSAIRRCLSTAETVLPPKGSTTTCCTFAFRSLMIRCRVSMHGSGSNLTEGIRGSRRWTSSRPISSGAIICCSRD